MPKIYLDVNTARTNSLSPKKESVRSSPFHRVFYLKKKSRKINKIENNEYEMYAGWIDTTFCLYNKKYFYAGVNFLDAIRIAGNFTCKHLPWYKDPKVISIYENYLLYKKSNTNISSIASCVTNYVENNFKQIIKNDEFFLIDNNDYDIIINYLKNQDEANLLLLNKYLNKNKRMLHREMTRITKV